MSNVNPGEFQIDGNRLLAIIREENPQAFELALRRAQIEYLQEQNSALRGVGNGQHHDAVAAAQ